MSENSGPADNPDQLTLVNLPAGLRKKPDPKTELFHPLAKPQQVTLIKKEDNWCQVKTATGQTGWVHRNFFAETFKTGQAEIQITAIGTNIEEPEKEFVKIALTQSVQPEVFQLSEGSPRIVADFFGATIHQRIKHEITVDGKLVKKIRQWAWQEPEKKVRIVLDLEPSVHYEVHHILYEQNNLFVLSVNPK